MSCVSNPFCFKGAQRPFFHLSTHSVSIKNLQHSCTLNALYILNMFLDQLNWTFFSPPDAIYDCASLYTKSYKISGEYKLPKDEFLGTPELNVGLVSLLGHFDFVFWTVNGPSLIHYYENAFRYFVIWRQTEAAGLWSKGARSAWRHSTATGSSTRLDSDPSVETSGWATNTSSDSPGSRVHSGLRWRCVMSDQPFQSR